jgi:AraC-like DNA-binding protein
MTFELAQAAPGPALRGAVLRYTCFAERAGAPVAFRELPCTYVPLIIDLGEGWSIADGRRPGRAPERLGSFVAGLTDGPVIAEHPGRARCLQVDMTPLAARRLLGLPMAELANRSVAAEDVLGPSWRGMAERLDAAPTWAARIDLVERALTARMADARPADPAIAWALGRLARGDAAVGELARELGWSHRRLIARVRDGVGLAPKLVARILRFERLTGLMAREPDLAWARAAAACGYADQAHLSREVRDLAGLTPTALRAGRVNSVQDPDGDAADHPAI